MLLAGASLSLDDVYMQKKKKSWEIVVAYSVELEQSE